MTKYCPSCKIDLPCELFFRNKRTKSGYGTYCKSCAVLKRSGWASSNKEAIQKFQENYRARRKKDNLCYVCGKNECIPHSNCRCETCWYKGIANKRLKDSSRWQEIKDIAIKQSFICSYTGDLLVPGLNMSIDHLLPTSKYPELAFTLSNLQWVTKAVNTAKSNLSTEEFIGLCRKVVSKAT